MITKLTSRGVFLAVISARRPGNVSKMQEQLQGFGATWFVPHEDEESYEQVGAETYAADGLVGARNAALDEAEACGMPCVQVSDDLKKIMRLGENTQEPFEITFEQAVGQLLRSLDMTDLKLAGCSPTDNAYFARETESTNLFIVGDLFVALPCDIRFDARLKLKEDYDYTCQHYVEFGGAKRLNWLMPSFQHRTNKGGAVAYRTADEEQKAISLLKSKWPEWVKDNPKRPDEVLLKLPRRKGV